MAADAVIAACRGIVCWGGKLFTATYTFTAFASLCEPADSTRPWVDTGYVLQNCSHTQTDLAGTHN